MASRGKSETDRLKRNVEEQLDRLVSQLRDLEETRDELDEEEYASVKEDTLEQLKEFQESLERMKGGDLTLVDDLNMMQLAIQAAISDAFKTPEVIRMFAKKQPEQLRLHVAQVERDEHLGKLSKDYVTQQKIETYMALKKLGEELLPAEEAFLESNTTANLKEFDKISGEIGGKVLDVAGSQVKAANR